MKLIKCILIALLAFVYTTSKAQLSLTGDFRARSEYRHGFQSLAKDGQDAAFFTAQRSRINLNYGAERYHVRFSVQDVRTWGSQPQIVGSDGLMSVHEAWLEYFVTKKFSVKGGRMELAYDDHRIFGNLDWAMAGRKHDLMLLKYTDSTWTVHAGFAYNQDREQNITNLYTIPNSYKAMQYLWANKQFRDLSLSFLFLNNGLQFTEEINGVPNHSIKYSQTVGTRWAYKRNKFAFNGFGYSQTGKDGRNRDLSAYDIASDINFQVAPLVTLTGGFEYLSGTSQLETNPNINRSFSPFYGTNHLFNGYMDYFYVGNHFNSVGLQDIYLKASYKLPKGFVSINCHNFQSAAAIRDVNSETGAAMNSNLGNAVDLTIRQQFTKELAIQAGYSQMFATSSMEALKGGNRGLNNNWAYVWVIFKPDFMKKAPVPGSAM
jgi:hypothetical protein